MLTELVWERISFPASAERPGTRANAYQAGVERNLHSPLNPILPHDKGEWEMPREFIASDGRIFFRTKLLAFEQAQRFALCLEANASRFCDVDFLLSDKAKGERAYFVQFRPVNVDRQWEQIERQQEARRQRAVREGACYVFVLDMDGPRPFYWCFNPLSGETYQTDAGSCTCPDFHYRCKKLEFAALYCKHLHALLHAFEIGELVRLSEVYDTPEWLARHPLLPVPRYPGDCVDPFAASAPFAQEVRP